MPDKPFFIYFAPGATHAPHHVPKEWADKYKGKFDQGWDKLREETFARQKKLGVIPAGLPSSPRATRRSRPGTTCRRRSSPSSRARWRSMPASWSTPTTTSAGCSTRSKEAGRPRRHADLLHHRRQRRLGRRHAERRLQRDGQLQRHAALETPEFLNARIDKFGGPEAYNHYAVGWAHAMNTPYQWTKQVASHWGGTRNGTIVHWPNGIKAKGEIRSPVPPRHRRRADDPRRRRGCPSRRWSTACSRSPIEGVSMLYSFNDAKAAERHETQYFEMFGNRGIYHKGWTAVTRHSTPWVARRPQAAGLRRRRLGALRHQQGLEPGERPRQGESGEAARAAAPLADRGDALQRAAARRPDDRALQPGPRRPAAADQGQDRRSCSAAWAACPRTASSTSRTSRTR